MRAANDNLQVAASLQEDATFARLCTALQTDDRDAMTAWLNEYRSAELGARQPNTLQAQLGGPS